MSTLSAATIGPGPCQLCGKEHEKLHHCESCGRLVNPRDMYFHIGKKRCARPRHHNEPWYVRAGKKLPSCEEMKNHMDRVDACQFQFAMAIVEDRFPAIHEFIRRMVLG